MTHILCKSVSVGHRTRFSALTRTGVISVGLAILLSACGSRHFDREQAEQMLRENLKQLPATNAVKVGTHSQHEGMYNTDWLDALVREGVMTSTHVRRLESNNAGFQTWYDYFDIKLTPEGEKYKVGDKNVNLRDLSYPCSIVKMADRELVAVTGVRESDDANTATVEFQWRYSNLTPFGKVARLLEYDHDKPLDYTFNQPRNATVAVHKYDDGWRLDALPIKTPQTECDFYTSH